MRIALVTVPYTSAGRSTGEERAPAILRAAGLLDALRNCGNDVVDYGDVVFEHPTSHRDSVSGIIAPSALTSMALAVRAAVARAADQR